MFTLLFVLTSVCRAITASTVRGGCREETCMMMVSDLPLCTSVRLSPQPPPTTLMSV